MNEVLMQTAYWLFAICGVGLGIFGVGWVMLLRCRHPNPSFPVHGVQHCFDCGRQRGYVLGGKAERWK